MKKIRGVKEEGKEGGKKVGFKEVMELKKSSGTERRKYSPRNQYQGEKRKNGGD